MGSIGADIDGPISYDANNSITGDFGHGVALSSDGTILAVGDRYYSPGSTVNTGLVNVYQYSSGSWNQIGSSILGELDGSHFGFDVDLSSDGTILAVGAPRSLQGGDLRGAVLLYEYSNSSWSKIGDSILGSEAGARFGYDVSLSNDGTIVAAGEPYAYSTSGGVRIYQNSSGSWTQLGNAITNSSGQGDELGVTVDISGNGLRLAVGSPYDDGANNSIGSVKIYNYTPGTNLYTNGSWGNPTEILGSWPSGEMGRGLSMSYNGNMIALGGTRSNTNGAVNLYTYDGSSWTNASTFLGEAGGDYYGDQVSLSADGSIVAISGHRNDGNGTDAGHVEVFTTGLLDEIDSTPPTLTETTAVGTPNNDNTPNVVITSNEAGTITCSLGFSTSTSGTASANTITFTELSDGTYSGETVTFTDASGNSTTITLSTFVIDTTAPTFTTSPSSVTVNCGDNTDPSVTGQAIATDTSDLNYNFWNIPANGGDGNEPSNSQSNEHHAHFTSFDGRWNDHVENLELKHFMESSSDLGSPSGYDYLGTYNGSYYYLSQSTSGWNDAKNSAENAGGWLSSHETLAENSQVAQLWVNFGASGGIWIGLFQDLNASDYSEPAGAWKWIGDNVTVTYQDTTSDTLISREWTATDAAGNTATYTQFITISGVAAPTGDSTQSFCDSATVSDLVVTGQNIQWYDAATGGNLLDSTTTMTHEQVFYASQTVNSCESASRLAVLVSIHTPEISSSSTTICSGDSLVLTADSNLSVFTNWNEGEPNDTNGAEEYAYILDSGKWNDHNASYADPDFIMEGSTFLGTIEMESLGFNYLGSFQSSHYYQSTSSYTWNNAKTTAESYNYTLVIINSEGENNFLYNNANISSSSGSWIGLYQDSSDNSYSEPSGGWKWVDGTGIGDVTTIYGQQILQHNK